VFRHLRSAVCILCARLRVSWAPGFPCALAFERANADRITSGAPRREIAMSYPSPAARRIGPGSELEQYRAFFQAAPGPAHSCDPTAVPGRWTASKQWENARFFAGLAAPQLRRRASPNYTPSAPKLRLIATQVSDQIGSVKSRVALRRRGCACRTVPSNLPRLSLPVSWQAPVWPP
jgi:hypothetical protein